MPPLDATVAARLRALTRRLRLFVLVEGVAILVATVVAACLVQLALDYSLRLQLSMRAALLALLLATAGYILWRYVLRPARRGISTADVAALVERRFPQLSSVLISAVRFAQGEVGAPDTNSPALVATVIARAGPDAAHLPFESTLDARRARRSAAGLVSTLIVALVLVAAAPQVAQRWLERNVLLRDVPWWQRTHLVVEVEGDTLTGARGDDIEVRARAEGVVPREVDFVYRTASGRRARESMVAVGQDGFRFTIRRADEELTFYLEGGDDRTQEYRLVLAERPRVTATAMRIEPPAYAGLAPVDLGDGQRAARVLPGSSVTVWITTNKPVREARLMADRDVVATAESDEDRLRVAFLPTQTRTYHFELADELGLGNKDPVRLSIRMLKDEAPGAMLKLPGVGDMVTPEAEVPIELEFTDDYGLQSAALSYRLSRDGAADEAISLPTPGERATAFATSIRWPVGSSGAAPGDLITLVARARDYDDVSGPNEGVSADAVLRVVTRDELLAELMRREQELREDFARLVDLQERVRGDLLSALAEQGALADQAGRSAAFLPLERRQRNIAASANVIRQQYEQVVLQRRINKVDVADEMQRIQEGIVTPLTELSRRDLPAAADAMRRLVDRATPEDGAATDQQQAEILDAMRAILANMVEWQGYQEVVNMVRDILQAQQELQQETRKALERDAEDVFDD